MRKLKRSPFKVNRREKDPEAFGLRTKEIVACVEALFNQTSLVISGPKGIGKTSLGDQIQIILQGNSALLKRCGLDAKFSNHLCVYYPVASGITLDKIVLDILYLLEKEGRSLLNVGFSDVKPSFEIDLGIVKARLETEVHSTKRSPATTAFQFAEGLQLLLQGIQKLRYGGITILLDELDQLPTEIEFGKFAKVVHETLDSKNLNNVTFLFIGRSGTYTRFSNEHPSFERIVHHVPLSILDREAAEHVLFYAAKHASPPFGIEQHALDLILGLASGYPDTLHLIGNAAFLEMKNEKKMTQEDVLNGIQAVLESNKREKYLEQIKGLSEDEIIVLNSLSRYEAETLPTRIPYSWLSRKLGFFKSDFNLVATLNSLVQRGYLIHNEKQAYYQFAEELLKVFFNLLNMERRELISVRRSKQDEIIRAERRETEIQSLLRSGDVGDIDDRKYLEVLDKDEEEELVRMVRADYQDSHYLVT